MMLPFLIAAYLGRSELLVCAVYREAKRQGLDPIVVCALVEVESGWNPKAKSGTDDYGLFQINRRYHGYHKDIRTHISVALGILRHNLVSSNGNVRWALAKYNAGSVSKRGKIYASKVLSLAARIKEACIVQKYHTASYPLRVTMKDRLYGFQFEWAPRKKR
jgi:soluble lytic murein transglycosylase-like protein